MGPKKFNKQIKQNKPSHKSFKILKKSNKSNSSKIANLDKVEVADILDQLTTTQVHDSKKQSILDSKTLKNDILKDKEINKKSKETENDLLSQLDSIL
ncbi:hypothetical protein WICMUC_003393 [Wickerhamomyces mucosus]|uniref:Uncharacterized protein n=1 Tax=Wickerhamomyces mucosus TaxID=1378264 RepID=A0A9P8PLN3_9ASCO|nr:hypothetical protein WICMUC_003393 [Wickerhamomyces mucosus]